MHQHLGESRRKRLDMVAPSIAIFEDELVLAALFGRRASNEALFTGVAKNPGAELLVNQDSRSLPGRAFAQRQLEPVIDHLLAGDNRRCLLFRQRRLEAEDALFDPTKIPFLSLRPNMLVPRNFSVARREHGVFTT